ncbi:MAG TPA: ATP-dependent zinc metalloprotease FtsH [Ignavibacteria bacterium]|nr:ATP-dependent zinc metalloprotease FtsH [Ignavibacteria bacterium]HQY50842.1 ATP-dependent zinc metalloprotease FtsH [Ignavibacteria bacterium]HRB00254.1 ATP-dependent zinc metalloprotease FtsH [Ignavibacteria bacterium]
MTNNKTPKKNNNSEEFNWNRVFKIVLGWSAILIGFFLIMVYTKGSDGKFSELKYDQYLTFLNDKKIESAVIKKSDNNYEFLGKLKSPETITVGGRSVTIDKFNVFLPYTNIDDNVVKTWTESGVQFNIEKDDGGWMAPLLGALPWILIIAFWIIIMRRMQSGGAGGGKNIFSFGKSKAKLLSETGTKVTFNDVAGADEAKEELSEIIEFLKTPAKFQKLGGKIPRGVLLLGPPGTGKTLLARAVAGEAGVPFFSISGADFVEMFVGVGASRVRDLFEQGKKNAPCIIFIDEIDAVGRHRGAGLGGGHDEREQTLNQLLIEMDGFEQNNGVIIIAATNRPDILDPALLRPGRFDRQVVVDRPDVKGREGILKVHTRKTPLANDISIDIIAKGTPGFSGADIANLVNEAALLAARRNSDNVTMNDFEEAKDKVMMGTARRSLIISDKEKKTTAYHESGHVIVAKMIPESDPVHKVTIIPRGRALGVTTYLPIDEKHTYSKEYLEAMLAYAMGGRAAEKLIFNEYTTGASNDIDRATSMARRMVCEFGMSEKLGPISYGQKQEEIFLGREINQHRDYSESTQILIDDEIKRIIQSGMDKAERLLNENIDKLHIMSDALLERETLDSFEIDMIMRGEELPPYEKPEKNEELKNDGELSKGKKKKVEDDKFAPGDIALAN